MQRLDLSVVIGRPVEDVWKLITDMEAYSAAFGEPLGEHYRVTSPGPFGMGSIVEANDWTVGRVTEFETNHAIATSLPVPGRQFRHWAMRSATIGHRLESTAGGTQFVTWVEIEPTTVGRLLLPALAQRWKRRVRKAVAGVKRSVEASAAC